MPKLIAKNYHSDKNTYITNSKISLFLKSKEAYKRRYIDKTEAPEITPSILIGRAVDVAFEKGSLKAIDKQFCVMGVKEYKESNEKRERLTEDQYSKAIEMSTKLLNSNIRKGMKELGSEVKFQKVLVDEELGFAGMLDAMIIDEEHKIVDIVDLKTSAVMAMKLMKSYFYHCLEYGYFRQLAGYKHLVQKAYPDYEVNCYHIVIGSSDYYPVKIFKFDDELIDREIPFIKLMVEAIKNEKEFKDPVPDWDQVVFIKDINNNE